MTTFQRILVPLVALAAMLGLGPAALAAAPAPIATTTSFEIFASGYNFGRFAAFDPKVVGADGSTVYQGTVSVQTSPVGANTWTTVASGEGFASYSIDSLDGDFDVRAVYAGHTGTDPTYDKSYSPSTSATVTVHVQRGIKLIKESRKVDCFKVGPTAHPYKNKPIKYYFRKGTSKTWHFGGVQMTNKKSEYCIRNPKKHHVATSTTKGPKHGGFKTVFVKAGGMSKYVDAYTW